MTDPKNGYNAVPAQVDLPAMEHEVLQLWQDQKTFEATLDKTADGKPFVFFEGPPTANGTPGVHHVEARVFKDVFPRFKTMQGYHVERKAGWDCHGLPVELAVEKELGFSGKQDIENFGVEAFNKKCRESVKGNVDQFEAMTARMGYWVNMDEAYRTMDTSYVESGWWALKTIFDKGLLVESHRVAPYCPRCGTTLSDHELAQGYEDTKDTTAFVRFPVTSGPVAGQADILIWTTTPWTLISNALVAVGPDIDYVVATKDGEKPVVVGAEVMEKVLGEGWTATQHFLGKDMAGWTYQRALDVLEQPGKAWFVVEEDYVSTSEGTGLVHQAMAFGEVDYASCARNGIEYVNPVGPDGHFDESMPLFGGLFFKSADPVVLAKLEEEGLLFSTLVHEHSYPHCWRCGTPLLYYAQPSWYIKTTKIKQQLIEQNENTAWHPETIKHGRFGDWLENNVDWALSRSRYWGTPLPIWRNDEDPKKIICVGSRAELGELAGMDLSELDPHRPYVDDVTFTIPGESGTYRRVPEVCDAWFDSGSMPFAQWGYPWVEGSAEKLKVNYPADFIAEAIDQTRGWFYTMLAMGVLAFDESSYKNVLCLGHILAEDGRKMSKHLGNILLPIPLMDEHGADSLRWFMAAGGSPWAARRVGNQALQEVVRKVILTYWNTVAFQALYARANDWSPAGELAEPTHVLDVWLTSATNHLVREVTEALEGYDTLRAGALLGEYIDELSNWYVRRSRRRFWDGDAGALSTLHRSLVALTQLLAPLMPFVTERVWQDLVVAAVPGAEPSVHLSSWPVADEVSDATLEQAMELTRRLVELGRAARAESKMKTRQPLARLLISSAAFEQLSTVAGGALLEELKQELNVEAVESFAGNGELVEFSAKGNFRALGKRFGKETPQIANAIAAADAAALAAALRQDGKAMVGDVEVLADEVFITERPREGWSVVSEAETVALDLELTPQLKLAGLAREAVRMIQEARKSSGFEVSDRITLTWNASGEMADAFAAHQQLIADEVLATSVVRSDEAPAWIVDEELGLNIAVAKA